MILAFLPFMTLYTLYFNKKMAAALELGRRRVSDVNAQVEDSLSGCGWCSPSATRGWSRRSSRGRTRASAKPAARATGERHFAGAALEAFSSLIPIAVAIAGGVAILQGNMPLPTWWCS